MRSKAGLPVNVSEFRDSRGTWRLRFRKKGMPTYYFKARFGTPEFRAELEACRAAAPTPEHKIATRIPAGSLSALIAIYYTSPEFLGLKPSSQRTYRNQLDRFRAAFGDLSARAITRAELREIIGAMSDRPAAANNLLDRIRVLMKLALDMDWRPDDPTIGLRGFRVRSDGFHTWTDDEIETFRARHPSGSRARLAMLLLLCTGQRRSDIVGLGRQNIDGGRIILRQRKTGAALSLPIQPELAAELALVPAGQMVFLLTEFGKPFSDAGFGNWFRDRCTEAGLPQCSAHGLRKAAARIMAESGSSHSEIKAITGHRTDREVTRYTAAADQIKLADQAMERVARRTKGEQPNG